MKELLLFTDGSVHTQSGIGFGAYLLVSEPRIPLNQLKTSIKVKRFEQTSSTKLELQTLLWALNEIPIEQQKIIVYTDSQNILSLLTRRSRLEQNDFRNAKNIRLNNFELYQEFYKKLDQFNCQFVKVKGHQKSHQKDDIDQIFTLVDQAARHALRNR